MLLPPVNLRLTRQQRLQKIMAQQQWDIIVVGGGITGAGIFKLASQLGLNVLLLEQKDFAWGSSSRSSKMVHGGLRYIAQGQLKLTQESVKERQRLLQEAPYLVTEQSFAFSHYRGKFPPPWLFNSLLYFYDHLAGKKQHQYWAEQAYQFLIPNIAEKNNVGGTQFTDALVDDARMVLRLIQEGQQLGGLALNYSSVQSLTFNEKQVVNGVKLMVELDGSRQCLTLKSHYVINATGAWAKQLLVSSTQNKTINIRPLRGSHLVIPSWRLPVASAVSVMHPKDGRPVQIYPWQKVTLVGTTDVEHNNSLLNEPHITPAEVDYLLMCVHQQFPYANITHKDIISTYAGIRPVVADKHLGKVDPQKEKRDHSIWQQGSLITVAGGKLTTFRLIAKQVLERCAKKLSITHAQLDLPAFLSVQVHKDNGLLPLAHYQHLLGCYGQLTDLLLQKIKQQPQFAECISYSCHLWGELWWAVNFEQVEHLDDLLLRRTRIGNVLPRGGIDHLDKIKHICADSLPWSEEYWQKEIIRYQKLWKNSYSLPSAC